MDRQTLRENVRMVMPAEVTDVADSNINALLDQGINEISTQFPWPWLEATANISLVADTRTASLPNDFLFGGVLVDDDEDQELPFIAALEFFRRTGNDTGNSSANPDFYTIYDSKIYFSQIPDTNDTDRYTFYYYKNPTLLVNDAAEPAFNSAFHWILVEYAKWKLYERAAAIEPAITTRASYQSYLGDMKAWYGRSVQRAPFLVGDGMSRFIAMRDRNIPLLNQGF